MLGNSLGFREEYLLVLRANKAERRGDQVTKVSLRIMSIKHKDY